jgi:hypothetical protein
MDFYHPSHPKGLFDQLVFENIRANQPEGRGMQKNSYLGIYLRHTDANLHSL